MEIINDIFLNFVNISIKISVILLVLLIFLKTFDKKYTSKFKYVMWLIISIRLALPFNITIQSPIANLALPQQSLQNSINTNQTIVNSEEILQTTIQTGKTINMINIISLVWLIGVVLFIGVYISSYLIKKKKLKRWYRPILSKNIRQILDDLCCELNIRRKIKIFKCAEVKSPMLIGFIKPKILLPASDFSDNELELIIHHELIHYKKHDIWFKLLLLIVNALHWFNPIVYIMVKQANFDIELACDEKLLQNSSIREKQNYSKIILKLVSQKPDIGIVFYTNFYGGVKGMKKRFERIMDTKKKSRGILILSFILVMSVFSSVIFAYNNQGVIEENFVKVDEGKQNQTNEEYKIYEEYGLTYDKEKDAYFYKEVKVRNFYDYLSDGTFENSFRYYDGKVDLYATRNNKDELTGIRTATEEESKRITEKIEQNVLSGISGIVENCNDKQDFSGETVEKFSGEDTSLKDYIGKGNITFNKIENKYYFGDKRIACFYDEGYKTLISTDIRKGDVILKVIRNSKDEIDSIVEINKEEFKKLIKN